MNVRLDPDQQEFVEKLAAMSGRSPEEVVRDLIEEALSRRRNSGGSKRPPETAYEAFERAGLIGLIEGGPSDVSTNPKYFHGFGRDG